MDRTERTDRGRRPERTDRPDRGETDRTDRPERRERPDRESEDSGSPEDNRSGGRPTVRPDSTRNLRTYGPAVSHFHGKVEKVFGTSQRSKPSTRPLVVAGALLVVAVVLPYAIAVLPLIAIALVALLWLRQKGWVRGGMRLPRFGGPPADDRLQTVTFRVKVACDDGRTPFTTLDCRLVQRAESGPVPLAAGDVVTGSGRRWGGRVIEVARLDVGGLTTLNSTNPKSDTPILVLAALGVLTAAALLYLRWDTIPPVTWEGVMYPVLTALVPPVVIYVVVKKVILRR